MTARIAALIIAVVLAGPWLSSKWTGIVLASAAGMHPAGHVIRIVPRNGPPYVESLDGIGCSEALCSRVFVRVWIDDDEGTALRRIPFDTVAAIEMLGGGDARIRSIDGTAQPVIVAADNRVLYLIDQTGRAKTLDLSKAVSIEFLR
jgi:hypothetical protein